MISPELENLVRTGKLKHEPPAAGETLGIPAAIWRVLAKGHERRNLAEYEGLLEVDERLVTDLIDAGKAVLAALRAADVLPPQR